MTVAWGVLVPIGILLALFYKVVWPEGEWFYVSGWSSRLSFLVWCLVLLRLVLHCGV